MAFNKQAPEWGAIGIEPPESKRLAGWEVEDRPPAAWLNWFMNLTAESLQELQEKATEKTYVDEQIAEAIGGIDVDVPDASLTVKGITQLNSAVDSISETEAATPKSVKIVNDTLTTHMAEDATLTTKGHVQLSNATDGTRENVAATEKAVGQAFQAGNERKAEVVAVLVAKGISATTSEIWDSLLVKLTALIRALGNATLADVLAGKTFSNDTANNLVGTMPDYSGYPLNEGYVNPKSFKVDGNGSLVIEPNTGYYKSGLNSAGFGAILINDPEFIAPYFRADVNVFGLQGSMPVRRPDVSDQINANSISFGAASPGDSASYIYLGVPNEHLLTQINWVRYHEPNLIASNVRTGVPLFGGALVGTYGAVQPGATQIFGHGSSSNTRSTSMTPIYGVRVTNVGSGARVTVGISLRNEANGEIAAARVYINGVARGIIRNVSTNTGAGFYEDFDINENDLISVYAASGNSNYYAYVTSLTIHINAPVGTYIPGGV